MKIKLATALAESRSKGTYRFLRDVTSAQGREIIIDGHKMLNFSSNDYLGLAADQRLAKAASEASGRYGFGAGASRLLSGSSSEHLLLERELAAINGAEAALVFNSGYMANVGVIPALCHRGDDIFSDRLNHASILDGIVLSRARLHRYAHNDMGTLDRMLKETPVRGRRLIVTDAVFSMDGDAALLREITEIAARRNAWVMVDEAHSFGLFGPGGSGLAAQLGIASKVDVRMGTLSKSVGAYGAYITGSRELIDFLVNSARSFIFSTAFPPAMAAAARIGLKLMAAEPWRAERALALSGRLRLELRRAGFDVKDSVSAVVPVMVGDTFQAAEMSAALWEKGIYVPAIRPPAVPSGTSRLRISVTAVHHDGDLERLVKALVELKSGVDR